MRTEADLPWEISCKSVKAKLDAGEQFYFLDCREQDEYDLVHIGSTKLVPLSVLPSRVAEIEPYKNQSIVVHCHHGGRSMRVAQWLRQNGFEKAQSMAGGIHTWAEEIEPGMKKY